MNKLPLNKKLGLGALALGLLAIFGNPYPGAVSKVDAREMARIVETKVDHVTATDLADWIIEGRADYRLIDLREAASYSAYHIPGAENVPLTQLIDYGLERNEKIILYSDGGIHSAQAWFLLNARDYKAAYMLLDGLNAWKGDVLFPEAPAQPTEEEARAFEKSKHVSTFFGGQPQGVNAEATGSKDIALPELNMPTQAVPVKQKKKRSREGC